MTLAISTIVQWMVLPLIMFSIFALAWILARSAKTAELRVSSWAGFWAGLLSFVIYVVSQLSQIRDPALHFSELPGLQPLPLGLGLIGGFVFFWIVQRSVPTRLVGLMTLVLGASSTSALFTYLFIDSLRVSVLYLTLGTALGILVHVILFPASLAHILPATERKELFLADVLRKPKPGDFPLPGETDLDGVESGERACDGQGREQVAF
jgi:hypothetical protein